MSPGARDGGGGPVPVFAALGDPHRLRIVRSLSRHGPQTVVGLTEGSGISRQAISKHLVVLDRAGLLRSERRGRERVVELDARRLREARQLLGDVSAQWDRALGRLRRYLES